MAILIQVSLKKVCSLQLPLLFFLMPAQFFNLTPKKIALWLVTNWDCSLKLTVGKVTAHLDRKLTQFINSRLWCYMLPMLPKWLPQSFALCSKNRHFYFARVHSKCAATIHVAILSFTGGRKWINFTCNFLIFMHCVLPIAFLKLSQKVFYL